MRIPDSFSPYLDPEPIADFFDDLGQRASTTLALAIIVHIGLFMTLQLQFNLPELPDEPEPIKIQIISFEPEPEIIPEVKPELRPVLPNPAQAPTPRAKPKPPPRPKPKPAPIPEPIPELEPIPEPEPIVIPPQTEILVSETIELEPQIVAEPLPIPEPPVQEITPEPTETEPPVVEIFEPLPEPIIEPTLEPVIEIFEPIVEPLPEPIIEIFEPEPIPEPLPEPIEDLPPAPVITETPVSGLATEELIPEPIEETPAPIAEEIIIEPIVEALPVPEPAPLPEIEPEVIEPEVIEPELPVAITTTPTILASPDAPSTDEEEQLAIPSAQATPLETILQNARPKSGGGNQGQIPIGAPPGGGTRPSNPGTKGWTLAPGSWGEEPGKGYKGLVLDIRCREAGRTHEDCPEYIRKNQGRNAAGFEAFGAHTPRGTTTTRSSRGMNMDSSIFQGGTYGGPSAAMGGRKTGGNSDDNTGSPSTSVLDDTYLPQYDLSIPIPNGGSTGGRVRDVFGNPKPAPWTLQPDLPTLPEVEDDFKSLILKPKQKPDG